MPHRITQRVFLNHSRLSGSFGGIGTLQYLVKTDGSEICWRISCSLVVSCSPNIDKQTIGSSFEIAPALTMFSHLQNTLIVQSFLLYYCSSFSVVYILPFRLFLLLKQESGFICNDFVIIIPHHLVLQCMKDSWFATKLTNIFQKDGKKQRINRSTMSKTKVYIHIPVLRKSLATKCYNPTVMV